MTTTDIAPSRPQPRSESPLAAAMAGVRRRGQLMVTERWLVVAGGIMMPLGAVLILLGWYGAAHTGRLFEQVPYLISGGLFGLALVVLGAACYFGYWIARLVATQRDTLGAMLRMEELLSLGGAAVPVGATTAVAAEAPAAGVAAAAETFVATRTGTMYHRAECPVVVNRPPESLRVVAPSESGLTPCGICLG